MITATGLFLKMIGVSAALIIHNLRLLQMQLNSRALGEAYVIYVLGR
jgi:hypothetical protein